MEAAKQIVVQRKAGAGGGGKLLDEAQSLQRLVMKTKPHFQKPWMESFSVKQFLETLHSNANSELGKVKDEILKDIKIEVQTHYDKLNVIAKGAQN
eukprot:5839930-Amphidinium_carterae.1